MTSVAGNKRRHKENTIEAKYAALKELERGVSNKDVSEKFKEHIVHMEEKQGQNNCCIQK